MNDSAPSFSVIIPLFNKEGTISRAIQSVLAQSIPDFELIVVNDGSTDNSLDAVLAIDDSRIAILEQENQGVSVARNRGVEVARSNYLAFLDADDEWLPDFLSVISNLTKSYPDAGAYATAYYVQNPDHDVELASLNFVPKTAAGGLIDSYYRCIASGNNPVWSSAVCIPKSVFVDIGCFPAGVRLYEDLYMWSSIAIKYPIAFSNEPSSIYHRDADNRACNEIVPTRDDLEFSAVLLQAIKDDQISGTDIDYAHKFIGRYALLNSFKAIVAGNRKEGRDIALEHRSIGLKQKLKKCSILLLSYLPPRLIEFVWLSGRRLKNVA